MAKSIEKLIKKHQKYTGITKQMTISAGRVLTRYRSRVIYNEKLITRYFYTHAQAKNHLKYLLISDGKTVKSNNALLYKKPKRTYENSPFSNYPFLISA